MDIGSPQARGIGGDVLRVPGGTRGHGGTRIGPVDHVGGGFDENQVARVIEIIRVALFDHGGRIMHREIAGGIQALRYNHPNQNQDQNMVRKFNMNTLLFNFKYL